MADAHSTLSIYVITNAVNGKQYVGQTRLSIAARWRAHRVCAFGKRPFCRLLYAAIRKYGPEAFTIQGDVLPLGSTQADLDAAEQSAIIKYGTLAPNGYNLHSKRGGRGAIHEDTKALMSAAHIGRPKPAEWRENIRRANSGKKYSAERIEAMRVGRWSRPFTHSAETRAKISAKSKGQKQHPNTAAGLRASWERRRLARQGAA